MNHKTRWLMPITAIALGLAIAGADYVRARSLLGALAGFSIVVGYVVAVMLLQKRFETASVLAGVPVDERWATINQRALASTAAVLAVVLVVAFVAAELTGGDALAYAGLAAIFTGVYLGSILWFRWRS